MKKFAVGYINFFDNKLKIEIVEAENKVEALAKHSELNTDENVKEWLRVLTATHGEDIESIKEDFFNGDSMIDNGDSMIDVVEIV